MPQQFRHLQYDERCQIQALHQQRFSVTAIAAQLQRHKSTICRELQRNAGPSGYHHDQAQQLARERRQRAVIGPRKVQPPIWNLICDRPLTDWSPEQVAGYLKRAGAVSVSFSWLYQQIHQDRAQGGSLYTYLRQRGKPRRCKATRGSAGRGCIPGRRDLSKCPAIVDSKQRCGDWEADTIIGKAHEGAAVTLLERKSKYLLAQTVSRKTAALVGNAMQNLLRPFSALALTVTCDNGKEFAGHRQTAEALDTDLFFARPYRSCERGLNEHTNGLLRQFVPQTENLRTLARNGCRKPSTGSTTAPARCLATALRTRSSATTVSRPASTRHPKPRNPVLSDQGRNAAPPPDTLPPLELAGPAPLWSGRPFGPDLAATFA